jgi:hypothetical protein
MNILNDRIVNILTNITERNKARRTGVQRNPHVFEVKQTYREVVIDPTLVPKVNAVALTEKLKAAYPGCTGIGTNKDGLHIYLPLDATAEDLDGAKQIALKHDPAELTPDQAVSVARRTRAREIVLKHAAQERPTALPQLIEYLAEKVELMEIEKLERGR